MRVGLVLGGGGVVGAAYHAAALASIEHHLDWDPRTADVVVGTSAGSLVGSLLRLGVPAMDLAALLVGADALETAPELAEHLRTQPELPPMTLRMVARLPRLPHPGMVARWLTHPWRFDPVAALTAILPDGSLDLVTHLEVLAADDGDEPLPWPAEALWLTAVGRSDLRRVVFGRDRTAPLAHAVAASCAVPAYFSPVQIDGTAYVDGGVRSPTNADVLRSAPLDLAIIVSPMSGRELSGFGMGSAMRRHAHRKLSAERAVLHDAGIPSVVIEPGPEVVEAMGGDMMCADTVADVVSATFLDTGDLVAAPFTRTLLAGLNERDRRAPRRPVTAAS